MSGAASETCINCKIDESVTRDSMQYLRLAVKRNFVPVLQQKNYYGKHVATVLILLCVHAVFFSLLVKHYNFLLDGTADASVKSFLEGDRELEEFQKVKFVIATNAEHMVVVAGNRLLS